MKKKLVFISVILLANFSCVAFQFINNKTSEGALCPSFIAEIARVFQPDIFVETGTYDGQTALNAAPFFKEVHTVELAEGLYQKCKERLSDVKNVHVYHGQSPAFLKKIIPQCQGTVVFWLDAHYSGGNTAMSYDNYEDSEAITPIRQELTAIACAGIKNCAVLIDDVRSFGSIVDGIKYASCWAYPNIQEICKLGLNINPNFAFALLGDTLLMYDKRKYNPTFSNIVKACTKNRLYDGFNMTDQDVLDNEKAITCATNNEEKAYIKYLYDNMTEYNEPLFVYDLWYALTCMGSGDWKEASVAMSKVPSRVEKYSKTRQEINKSIVYKHWRIDRYLDEINKHI